MNLQQIRQALMAVLLMLCAMPGMAQDNGHTLNISVTEKGSSEAIIMATLQLQPSGAMAVTDVNGKAVIGNVPSGEYTLQISYVGFEPISTRLKVSKDMQLKYQMTPSWVLIG